MYFGCNRESDNKQAPLRKVRVQLQWFDGAQFAGLYVAKNNKYFEREGLDVELISGSYTIDPFQVVREGKADIGMATGDRVLIEGATKKEIKAFGTVFNKSLACFMSKKDRIKDIADFRGKKIGVYRNYDTENVLLAMLKRQNIPQNEVTIVDAGLLDSFKKDEIDLFPSYVINEPISMKLEGTLVDIHYPESIGVEFYSDTYFSDKKYWAENQEVIKKFLKASAEGWREAKNNPEAAMKIMFGMITNMTYEENHKKQLMALEEAIKHLGAGNQGKINLMESHRWLEMEKSLKDIGKIQTLGNVNDLCDFTAVE
jgi:NitT/TauT family transport system substrate-binding protein